jgi:Zinc knuckle
MLKDGSNPTTLLDWQKLAIKKHSAYLNLRHKLETQKDTPKWAQVMMKKKPPKEHKDPFAMDVDVIWARTMDKDKKDRLQKEGRCFFCEKQGHLSRQCPKKQGGTKPITPAAPKPQARVTKTAEEDETTQVGDNEEPLTQLRTLQAKLGKGAFTGALDEMVAEEDF